MYSVIIILKRFHLRFRSFPAMESALADPLENMEKEVWRFLCEKWSAKDYKVRCRKNKLNWEKLKVLHTAGSARKPSKKCNMMRSYKLASI